MTKSYGERLRSCSPRNTNPEIAQGLSPEVQTVLGPLLAEIESLSERIREYNQQIEQLAQGSYPEVALLKQVKGVGTLIALTYLLTLGTRPHHTPLPGRCRPGRVSRRACCTSMGLGAALISDVRARTKPARARITIRCACACALRCFTGASSCGSIRASRPAFSHRTSPAAKFVFPTQAKPTPPNCLEFSRRSQSCRQSKVCDWTILLSEQP
jgi:hypothetical protein